MYGDTFQSVKPVNLKVVLGSSMTLLMLKTIIEWLSMIV